MSVVCVNGPTRVRVHAHVRMHAHMQRLKVDLNNLSAFQFVVIKHCDQNQLGGERVFASRFLVSV